MTRARQEQVLKNQQERNRAQAQALENRANSDNTDNRNNRDNRDNSKNSDTRHSTLQPDDTADKTDGISDTMDKKLKGKA